MPYQADIEGLIWLVVIVVSIISQIMKGAKKVSAKKPRPGASPSKDPVLSKQRKQVSGAQKRTPSSQGQARRDPSDELRQFFETLGMPTENLAPAGKPATATAPQARRKMQQARQKQMPATKKAAPPPPAPQPVMTRKAEALAREDSVKLEHLKKKMSKRNRDLRDLLKNQRSQQQAIALREILGPPVALR